MESSKVPPTADIAKGTAAAGYTLHEYTDVAARYRLPWQCWGNE